MNIAGKIIRRAAAAGCAGIVIMLSGCTDVLQPADSVKSYYEFSDSQFVNDLQAEAKTGAYKAAEHETQALASMEEMLSNEYISLYMGKYYDIAVLDKETGKIFFSNRAIYENPDELSDEGKADAFSQVSIEYYDGASAQNTMSSYPDSINDDGMNQVRTECDGDTLKVTYCFGTDTANQNICYVMSKEGYDELEQRADEVISEGRLDRFDFARFQRLYQAVVYDELDDAGKSENIKKYPGLEELGTIYVCEADYLTTVQRTLMEEVSSALKMDADFVAEQKKLVGIENSAGAVQAYFEIPVIYRIHGRDLVAQIDTPNIVHVENSGYYLTKIYLLSNFFASTADEEGYLLVSDGSGAVIENDSRNENTSTLTQTDLPFYGSDFGLDLSNSSSLAPYSVFPVFGIQRGSAGVFGIVESGDAMGGVRVKTENSLSKYNAISPYFTYYAMDIAQNDILDQQENVVANRVYSKKKPDAPYVVRYHFLYGEKSGYSGMAAYYRAYLCSTGSLTEKDSKSSPRLDLSFIGAVTKRQMIGFVPMNVEVAASTFENIQRFAEELEKDGIDDFDIALQGSINGGMQFRIPQKLKIEKSMGGAEGYKTLADYLEDGGNKLYLDVDFTKVYRNGNGLDTSSHIARFISNNTAVLSGYSPANGERDPESSAHLINPLSFDYIIGKFKDAAEDVGINEIRVSSMGSYLSGNYDERHELTREDTKNIVISSLENLRDSGYNLLIDGGNIYTLKYAGAVTDVPLESSGISIESYTVPFVGMVLHGCVDYSGVALNQQGSYQNSFLKSIENGAGLHYILMTEDPLLLADTSCSNYYSVSVDEWKEEIVSAYEQLSDFFYEVSDSAIVQHSILSENVVQVRYENGSSVLINYNDQPVTVGETTIDGMDYCLLK